MDFVFFLLYKRVGKGEAVLHLRGLPRLSTSKSAQKPRKDVCLDIFLTYYHTLVVGSRLHTGRRLSAAVLRPDTTESIHSGWERMSNLTVRFIQ